jgi:hypothetical protein
MSVIIAGSQLRTLLFGTRVEKSTGTLAATTVPLFTVAGGEIILTSMTGLVTTSITVANSYKLQHNPTLAGAGTNDFFAATDIGTTDTVAGELLTFDGIRANGIIKGATGAGMSRPIALSTGQIESVSAGTDGVILWVATYVPLTDGATLVAA